MLNTGKYIIRQLTVCRERRGLECNSPSDCRGEGRSEGRRGLECERLRTAIAWRRGTKDGGGQ